MAISPCQHCPTGTWIKEQLTLLEKAMQRFGFKTLIVFLIIVVGAGTSCAGNIYRDDDMARLSTLVRTTMSIVKGEYYGKTMPSQISEIEIIQIVRTQNS